MQADRHQNRKCNGRTEEETTHQCSFTLLLCPVFVLSSSAKCMVLTDKIREHHFASVVTSDFSAPVSSNSSPHLLAFSQNGQINTFTFRLFTRNIFVLLFREGFSCKMQSRMFVCYHGDGYPPLEVPSSTVRVTLGSAVAVGRDRFGTGPRCVQVRATPVHLERT